MHADEVAIDEALVRRLVAAQFPDWAGLPLEPVLPRGTDNALYRLGDDMVVRLPRRERTAETLAKERRWLPRLAPLLPVAVPVPVADGTPGEGFSFAWCVYSWLEGETAPLADAVDLAEFIAALQRIDPSGGPPPGEHNFFRGAPLATRDAATRASIAALGIDGAVWESAIRAPEWDRAPVWIHGDLDARNLLVHDGCLSGVVDWGGLGVGDPACDVMVAWKALSPEGREKFRAELEVDNATWTRARGWAISTAVNALTYYTEETNAALVREACRWLAEALDDDAS
jgi:aminoglycoside phosphotransferase (APT) family kinase protein